MFFLCLLIFVFLLLTFAASGIGFKRLLKVQINEFNLITGYLLVIIIISIFKLKILSFLLISIFVLIGCTKLNNKKNYFPLVLILLYLFHFLSLAFIDRTKVAPYFYELNKHYNLSSYQEFTVFLGDLFNLHNTVFTINILTSLNIFISLYTIFEVLSLFFKKKKEYHLACLLYLFFFTLLNSVNYLFFPYNAYQFIYYPFAGLMVYLLGIIPFQFGLFYIKDEKTLPLLLLINFASVYFYQESLLLQVLINISFLFTLIFSKETKINYLKLFPLTTLIPLFVQLSIFKYPNIYIMVMLFIILFFTGSIIIISKDLNHNKKLITNLYLLGLVISFLILISMNYREYLDQIFRFFDVLTQNRNLSFLLLTFYGFTFYSLLKIMRIKGKVRELFLIYPLIMVMLGSSIDVIPPSLILSAFPFVYLIIYAYLKKMVLLERVLVILITLWVSSYIFNNIPYLHQTAQNGYYRVSNATLLVHEYLFNNTEINNILVCDNLKNQLMMVTDKNMINDELLEYTINDKIPFDVLYIIERLEELNIDAVVIDKDKLSKTDFELLSEDIINLDYYIIYRF